MRERARQAFRVVRALVTAAVQSGGEHRLAQVAAAIGYAVLVALAPVVLAYTIIVAAIGRLLALKGAGIVGSGSVLGGVDLSSTSLAPGWIPVAAPWIAAAIALVGASAVFSQYVNAIALIWGQPRDRQPVRVWLRQRLLGILLLAASATLLVISSVFGSLLASLASRIERVLSTIGLDWLPLQVLLNARFVFGFIGLFVLFTVSVMVIPVERPRFADVLPGILVTSAAYVLGDAVLGAYLRSSSRFEVFGSFGTLVASLVWVYYSVLIVLYGAELTREIVRMRQARRRTSLRPEGAPSLTGADSAQ